MADQRSGRDRFTAWFTWLVTPGAAVAVALGVITTAVGFFQHHPFLALPVGAFVFMCCAAGLRFVDQYRERRRPEPILWVESGNGSPWDEPRYALSRPVPAPDTPQQMFGRLTEAMQALPTPEPQVVQWSAPAGINGGKKVRVTNEGTAVAKGCRGFIAKTFSANIPLKWQNAFGDELDRMDLAIEQWEYLVIPPALFTQEGVTDVLIRVFCDDDPHPPADTLFRMTVAAYEFPFVHDA